MLRICCEDAREPEVERQDEEEEEEEEEDDDDEDGESDMEEGDSDLDFPRCRWSCRVVNMVSLNWSKQERM